ncbi:MAG: YggT family protein [Lentisphaerae bacterium]|nr:YggT family protein [Lentisphaerota bacterium]
MNFATWDTLFNMLLIVFWFRIWTPDDDRNIHFNPYLAPLARLARAILTFVEPVFFGLSARLTAMVTMAVLLVLRALIAPTKSAWVLVLGFDRQPIDPSLTHAIAFSALSFGIFLFRIWGVSLLFAWAGARKSNEHTVSMLAYLSRPFSDTRIEWRPMLLTLYGAILVVLLDRLGQPSHGSLQPVVSLPCELYWSSATAPASVLKVIVLALAAWVQLLPMLRQLMFFLIIGSWISMFTQTHGLAMLCRDWMNLLLGPLRKYPIQVGMFDLSPIVFFIAIGMVHYFLMSILFGVNASLMGAS